MIKNKVFLLWTAAILTFIFVFRNPINRTLKVTRGYRNNNPGNLRLNFNKDGSVKLVYDGEIYGTDKEFKTFKNISYGYRAIFALLNHYINSGNNTINEIISLYAPSSENDTNSYIKRMEKMTGYDRDELIDQEDDIFMKNFVAAISEQENGITADVNDVIKGYNLFYT